MNKSWGGSNSQWQSDKINYREARQDSVQEKRKRRNQSWQNFFRSLELNNRAYFDPDTEPEKEFKWREEKLSLRVQANHYSVNLRLNRPLRNNQSTVLNREQEQ